MYYLSKHLYKLGNIGNILGKLWNFTQRYTTFNTKRKKNSDPLTYIRVKIDLLYIYI